jgi:hypothetical protein
MNPFSGLKVLGMNRLLLVERGKNLGLNGVKKDLAMGI